MSHTADAVARGWIELADRVFVRRYAFYDQNIGVVLGDGEALVIDTRSTYGQAREIATHLRELTPFPVTVVVDTHGHFDHAFGNAIFRPATIWGQAGCVPFMARTGESRKAAIAADEPDLADALAEVVVDPPDRTFDTTATIQVGGRPVGLHYLGRAHTDHDAVITVPGTGVVFGGDIVEHGNVPFYGDGYPLDWPATAIALADLVTPAGGILVPGHGDHAGRDFADAQARSITALADLARQVSAGDVSLDDAIAAHPFPDLPAAHARGAFDRALRQLGGALD
jgi:glyoxylase-like metal-dependent hydrolase (beta-lactamase superfamily II)